MSQRKHRLAFTLPQLVGVLYQRDTMETKCHQSIYVKPRFHLYVRVVCFD